MTLFETADTEIPRLCPWLSPSMQPHQVLLLSVSEFFCHLNELLIRCIQKSPIVFCTTKGGFWMVLPLWKTAKLSVLRVLNLFWWTFKASTGSNLCNICKTIWIYLIIVVLNWVGLRRITDKYYALSMRRPKLSSSNNKLEVKDTLVNYYLHINSLSPSVALPSSVALPHLHQRKVQHWGQLQLYISLHQQRLNEKQHQKIYLGLLILVPRACNMPKPPWLLHREMRDRLNALLCYGFWLWAVLYLYQNCTTHKENTQIFFYR